MSRSISQVFAVLIACLLAVPSLQAKGPGTTGGLTLIQAPGARASALGEAYVSSVDDIAGFAYNPSTLKTLSSGQASFLFQQGLTDDSFSQLLIGSPYRRSGLGLSVGWYDGGSFELNDGFTTRTVKAQRDLAVALGMAHKMGRFSIGATGKYFSSQLVETQTARAYAADFGLGFDATPRLRLGAALQNFGTQLKFVNDGDNLPRIARTGASYSMIRLPVTLLLDVNYLFNDKEFRPALGIETGIGPLAVRAGYKRGNDIEEFSIGSGFYWGRSALDYAFGLVDRFDSQHRVSYSMRFGGPSAVAAFVRRSPDSSPMHFASSGAPARTITPVELNRIKVSKIAKVKAAKAAKAAKATKTVKKTTKVASKTVKRTKGKIYVIKPGDNLAGIAKKVYGDSKRWKSIYHANKNVIKNPTDIEVGQKIALP